MTVPQVGTQLQFTGLQWYPVTLFKFTDHPVLGQAEKCESSYTDPTKHRWELLRGGSDWIWCLDCVAALQPTLGNEYIYHGGECR